MKVKIKQTPDKAIKELENINKRMRGNQTLKVGLPKGAGDYPDGTSVIMVGSVHEFGSPSRGIPQRSFLRSTVQEERGAYKRIFAKIGKQIVRGEITKLDGYGLLGLRVQKDVRDKITDIKEPTLKYREGNPLVANGHLRRSINYEVSR